MKIGIRLLLTLFLQFYFFSFQAQENQTSDLRNITFQISPERDSIQLDLFLPKVKKFDKTPLVFHIHGGAWVESDKNFEKQYYMRSLRDSLQKSGYAMISINYRLLNSKVSLNEQLDDAYTALNWLNSNASKYNLDLNNIGIMGEYAGSHLALMLAYSSIQNKNINFNYVIDLFGPTDLNQLFKTDAGGLIRFAFKTFKPKLYHLRNKLISDMTLTDIETNKSKVKEVLAKYSPINYINKNTKTPILIQQGNKDHIVPYRQSKNLKNRLDAEKVENQFITVEKGNHGFTTTPRDKVNDLIAASLAFIYKNYKK